MTVYRQENNTNDDDNEKLKALSINDNDNDAKAVSFNDIDLDMYKKRFAPAPRENRTHEQNEQLAHELADKFHAAEWRPYLAVAYSGIPSGTIYRHAATACEKGRNPAQLFMHLIGREKLWKEWKHKKETEKAETERDT